MSSFVKKDVYIYMFAFFCIFLLFGCAKKNNADYVQFNNIIVTNEKEDKIIIDGFKDNKLEKIAEETPFIDIEYKEDVNVFNIEKAVGENLINTKLIINTRKYKDILEKEYNYKAFKLSPDGKYLAFTSFKSDDYSSINNIQIYDIANKKYIKLPDDVMLSGNLFYWKDDENVVFYGVGKEKNALGKIYCYSLKDNQLKVYFDKIQGYITYFSLIDDDKLMLLEGEGDKNYLSICDISNNSKRVISSNVSSIFDSKVNKNKTLVYFVSKIDNNKNSIFKLDLSSGIVKRITFDFPKQINKAASFAVDDNDDVIIIGSNNGKDLIYKYNSSDNSVSLAYNTEGEYKIFSP